jgi:hypothetical protein
MTSNDKNEILEYLALAEARKHQGELGDNLETAFWWLFYISLTVFFSFSLLLTFYDMLQPLFD